MDYDKIVEASGRTKKWALAGQIHCPVKALEAVKRNGFALQFVMDQTEEICLEAVKQNGLALKYVQNQTEAICIEAVKEDGDALWYVRGLA